MLDTVHVPPALEPLFTAAQTIVGEYFSTLHADPVRGTIEVGGQRYILVRAAAMSVEFYATITDLYKDHGEAEARSVARGLLYDLAYAIGAADARAFHHKLDLREPLAKLSAGPIHFAHTGWAHVSILPESNPSADDAFLLIYDHPYSFEANAWNESVDTTDFPVCIMNAGYSAGWCTESFGISLVAVEICCKAMGDPMCRFIMAPPQRIEQVIANYLHSVPALARSAASYEIPGFFSRKQAEDTLRERELQYRSIFESVTDGIMIASHEGQIVAANHAAAQIYERSVAEMVGLDLSALTTASQPQPLYTASKNQRPTDRWGETIGETATGRRIELEFHATAFEYQHQPHSLVLVRDISERKRAEAERLRLQEQLVRQNERLRNELSLAHTVQQSLLPHKPPWSPQQLAVAHRTRAASVVSSDFYLYIALDDGRMLVALGDVVGTGVTVALVQALTISAIESQARLTPAPAACITALQARLAHQLESCDMVVSLLLVVVDAKTQRVWIANAGMPSPLRLRDGTVEELPIAGIPLGVAVSADPVEYTTMLTANDQIMLLSDGLVETRSIYGELFGYERLHTALREEPYAETLDHRLDQIFTAVATFTSGSEQRDDQTVVVVQATANAHNPME